MRTSMRRLLSAVFLLTMIAALLSSCLQYQQPSAAPDSQTTAVTATPSATPPATPTPSPSAQPSASDSGYKSSSTPQPDTANNQWGTWLATADAVMPPVIPVSTLFSPPQYINPTLSPDGKRLLVRVKDANGAYDAGLVVDLATGKQEQLPYPEGVVGVPIWIWAGDSKHVLLYIDRMGDQNYGLFSIDVATGKSVQILYEQGVRVEVKGLDFQHPNQVMITTNERDRTVDDLYRADILSGKRTLVMQNPSDIIDYMLDQNGTLRGINTVEFDTGNEFFYLAKKPGKLSKKFVLDEWVYATGAYLADVATTRYFCFSAKGDKLYYARPLTSDAATLMEMDVKTLEERKIFNDEDYEIGSIWQDLQRDNISAVSVLGERLTWKALDPSMQPHIDALSKLDAGDFRIVSSCADNSLWLVAYNHDTSSTRYVLYEPSSGKTVDLFNENSPLDHLKLAPMEPFSFMTSDLLRVEGYATFPVGMERKNLPMVILVHGGPQTRDVWGLSPEVQFLSSRGYLVLQVNFRGSVGYGERFSNAGDKQWGAAMQQDLTDAVHYAVDQGWANPKRVAIMGGSYGGYAALAGAAFTPDVYACAVDVFGPSSLLTLLDSVSDYWKPLLSQMYRSIGNPVDEKKMLMERSPLYHVDNIKIPLLIAQGGNDVRVKPQESEQIVQALKDRNLPVEYLYFPDSSHGLNATEDLVKFYTVCEQFLAQHIGGRVDRAATAQ